MQTILYCEAALPRAQISETEAAYIFTKHSGRRAPRPNRYKVSVTRVVNNLEVDRPREEGAAGEEEGRQREAAKAPRGAMGGRGRGKGASSRMDRQGGTAIGRGCCEGMSIKPTHHEISLASGGAQSVTIAAPKEHEAQV